MLLVTVQPLGAVTRHDCQMSHFSRRGFSSAPRPPRSPHLRQRVTETAQPLREAFTESQSASASQALASGAAHPVDLRDLEQQKHAQRSEGSQTASAQGAQGSFVEAQAAIPTKAAASGAPRPPSSQHLQQREPAQQREHSQAAQSPIPTQATLGAPPPPRPQHQEPAQQSEQSQATQSPASGAPRPPRSQHLQQREPTQQSEHSQAARSPIPTQATLGAPPPPRPQHQEPAESEQSQGVPTQVAQNSFAQSHPAVPTKGGAASQPVSAVAGSMPGDTSTESTSSAGRHMVPIVRYGPENVDLQPQDQLRPLLPTWNPPPTKLAQPEDLKQGVRLRCLYDDRWWAASVREDPTGSGEVKVGFDGWPARHDEMVSIGAERLYLHESFHAEYIAPPIPARYKKPIIADEEGHPFPAAPRPPRPKVFDPEKERMKRALRPPLPYNPEKERLKRQLRGQTVPPVDA